MEGFEKKSDAGREIEMAARKMLADEIRSSARAKKIDIPMRLTLSRGAGSHIGDAVEVIRKEIDGLIRDAAMKVRQVFQRDHGVDVGFLIAGKTNSPLLSLSLNAVSAFGPDPSKVVEMKSEMIEEFWTTDFWSNPEIHFDLNSEETGDDGTVDVEYTSKQAGAKRKIKSVGFSHAAFKVPTVDRTELGAVEAAVKPFGVLEFRYGAETNEEVRTGPKSMSGDMHLTSGKWIFEFSHFILYQKVRSYIGNDSRKGKGFNIIEFKPFYDETGGSWNAKTFKTLLDSGFFTLKGVAAHEEKHKEIAESTFSGMKNSFKKFIEEEMNNIDNTYADKSGAKKQFVNKWTDIHNEYRDKVISSGGIGVETSGLDPKGELLAQQAEWKSYVNDYEANSKR